MLELAIAQLLVRSRMIYYIRLLRRVWGGVHWGVDWAIMPAKELTITLTDALGDQNEGV